MPMLYGEGSRAFQRLQEEILRSTDDESIFAWVDKSAKDDDLHGLLADDPQKFECSGSIGSLQDQHAERKPLRSTNLGLSIQRDLVIPHMDQFYPMHETIIRYSISANHRTTQDNNYVEHGQKAKLHPMSDFDQERAGPTEV
ncbi:hypothetical protein MBLNU13_g00703t1 [Cladosporium sp. NU13]